MSALKKHYGWVLRNGRRVCGAKTAGGLIAQSEDDVTCQGCLVWLRHKKRPICATPADAAKSPLKSGSPSMDHESTGGKPL